MADTTIPEIKLAIEEADLYVDVIRYMVKKGIPPKELFDRVNKLTVQNNAKVKELQKKYGDGANEYIKKLADFYSSMQSSIGIATYSNNDQRK